MSAATSPPGLALVDVAARRARLLHVGFVLLCLLLAFWDLGGRSVYHRDVPRFGTIAREMVRGGDWLVPTQYGETYANKPILYVWAVAIPSAIAGDVSETWIRLPSAIGLLLAAWGAFAWAVARGGSRFVARLAALLVLTTAYVNLLGRSGRPDMLAAGFATWAAVLVDRSILGKGGGRDALWAGLALGAGFLSKGPVVALVPLFLVLWPRRDVSLRERARRSRPLLVLGIAVGVALLWLVPATIRGGLPYARSLVVDQMAERLRGTANHVEPAWYYPLALPFEMLPWTPVFLLGALAFSFRRVREAAGDGAHVAAAVLALLALSAVPTKEVRYAAPLVPVLAVAAAQATGWAADRMRRGAWLRRVAVAAVLLAAGALLVYWTAYARRETKRIQRENFDVLAALEAGVPAVVLAGVERSSLTPDDLFYVMARASFAGNPARLPTRDAAPRLAVVTLADRVPDADAARGEAGRDVTRVPRRDGSVVVVRRYGPR